MNAPAPGTPEWSRLVTASKVGAILGLSPYDSPLSMWRKMRGLDEPDAETDAMRRGLILEPSVLSWWHRKHPDAVLVDAQPTWTIPGVPWALATPDEAVYVDDTLAAVEAKTTTSWDEWGEPGTEQVPAWYFAQAMWQMALNEDARTVYMPVLGPWLDFREYVIERDDELIADMWDVLADFADSLERVEPPALCDHPADYRALCRLRHESGEEPTGTAVLGDELVDVYRLVLAAEDAAPVVRSRVLEAMGGAKYATDADGVKVARQQSGRGGVSLVRAIRKGTPHALINITTTSEGEAS